MFLPDNLKLIFGALLVIIVALGYAARRYPHVQWLRAFDFRASLTEEQASRFRRSGNRYVGVELALLGVVILFGFLAFKVMLFDVPTREEVLVAVLASAFCIGAGVMALVRNR